MTVYCGGAASAARPGLGATVAVGASSIAALLAAIPIPFAVPLAGYLGLVTYELATFCTGEPPALPTITAGDVAALLTLSDPVSHDIAIKKFLDLIGFYYWDQLCECSGVANPALPSPQADPTGGPTVDPRIVPPPTSVYCYDQFVTFAPATTTMEPCGATITDQWNLTDQLFSAPTKSVNRISGCANTLAYTLPSGVIGGQLVWTSVAGFGTARANAAVVCSTYNAAGTVVGGIVGMSNSPTNGNSKTAALTPGSGAAYIIVEYSDNTFTSSDQVKIEIQLTCSTTPTVLQPCCPPDQTLSAQIQSIMGIVTLIQRQLAPFAYNLGTVHTGLTGSGVLTVQGLIGAKIMPTTIPGYVGSVAGDPDTLWLESWVNWGNADGFADRQWLRSAPYLSLPQLASQFTKIGYSLAPGLVVDLTELKREP